MNIKSRPQDIQRWIEERDWATGHGNALENVSL